MAIRPARSKRQIRDAAELMLGLVQSNRDLYHDQSQMIENYYRGSWFLGDATEIPEIFRPPHGEVLVAYIDQIAVGTVAVHRMDDHYCELNSMFVPVEYRGRGVASALCHEVIDLARSQHYAGVRLTTGARQPMAHGLYRKIGFELVPHWASEAVDGASYFEFRL